MIHASQMMIGLNVECYKTDQDAFDWFQRLQSLFYHTQMAVLLQFHHGQESFHKIITLNVESQPQSHLLFRV